ncbi:MAG: hypothetical protein QOD06_325 [Candidatus Binatota bacterium]|nr:hypothetical protein [Candidatus Binatota bacterium]
MDETGLFEAMSTCRTIRRFEARPVPDELLRKVLTAATWAPSGGNRQPWRFVVVRDAALKRRLQELYQPIWKRFSTPYRESLAKLPEESRARTQRMVDSADHLADHLHEAPVIVVVCFSVSDVAVTDANLGRPAVVGGASIYTAVENLLLACRGVGLGGALTTLLCIEEPEVRKLLAIPDGWGTAAYIPIGYPAGKGHGRVWRKPVDKLVYLDGWEKPLFPSS